MQHSLPTTAFYWLWVHGKIFGKDWTGSITDLQERVVLPGLVNPHVHLEYTDMLGELPSQQGFTNWVGSNGSTQKFLGAGSVSTLLAEGFGAANPLRDDHSRRHPLAPCPAWLHGETSQGP